MLKKILSKLIVEYLLIIIFNILGWIASVYVNLAIVFAFEDNKGSDVLLVRCYTIVAIILFVSILYLLYNILFFLSSNKTFLTNMINLTRYRLKRYLLYFAFWAISPVPLLLIIINVNDFNLFEFIKDIALFLLASILIFPYTLACPLILFFITLPWLTKLIDNYLEQDTDDLPLLRKNYKLRKEIVNSKAE